MTGCRQHEGKAGVVREGFSLAAPVERLEKKIQERALNQGSCLTNFPQPEKSSTSPLLGGREMVSKYKASPGQPLRSHGALFA